MKCKVCVPHVAANKVVSQVVEMQACTLKVCLYSINQKLRHTFVYANVTSDRMFGIGNELENKTVGCITMLGLPGTGFS